MQGIRPSSLYKATYVYLGLPLLIFIIGWLNYGAALVFSLLFLLAFSKLYGKSDEDNSSYLISRQFIGIAFLLALLWCFFAGIGYFYYQSWDYHIRNALFRDLINYKWPIFYDKANTPLVYYMGFWLFPALIGKISALFSNNPQLIFLLSNIILLLYAIGGTILIFLHIAVSFGLSDIRRFIFYCVFFIFFSGTDIIGYLFFMNTEQPFAYHLDWWAGFIQYSSFTTSMFWVFNQFIPTALTVFLIFNEHKIHTFALLLVFILFLAPYPAISCAVLMASFAIKQFYLTSEKKLFLFADIFSIPNIIACFFLFPLIFLYFITNSGGIDRFSLITDTIPAYRVFLFLILECLLYIILICRYFYKNPLFVAMTLFLLIIPWFRFDQQNNFCMRTSISMLIALSYFCLSYLNDKEIRKRIICYLLLSLWILGSATGIMEFYRGFHHIGAAHRINLVSDDIYTLNQPYVRMPVFGWSANHQFSAQNYRSDIFWNYLAKK